MNNPLVSVIIACKNNSRYIGKALESIKEQTYKNIEIIVIDNFSTDGTYEIAKSFTDKVWQLGPERSTQFNFGFKKSSGELIYRIGAEFVCEKDLIEKAVKVISEDGFDALAIHNRSIGDSIWAKVRYLERESYRNSNEIVAVRFMKRSVFESAGMFNEELVAGEDFDLHNRIVDLGFKWTHLDAVENHIGEPANILEVWNKFYYYGRTIKKYKDTNKNRAKQQLAFFRPSFKKLQSELMKEPKLFIAFWFYMFVKYVAGFTGMLRGYPKSLLVKKSIRVNIIIFYIHYLIGKLFLNLFCTKTPKLKAYMIGLLYSLSKFTSLVKWKTSADISYIENQYGKFNIRPHTFDVICALPDFEWQDVAYTIKLIDNCLKDNKKLVFLDVGGDFGLYSIIIGRKFHKDVSIYSFEPFKESYDLLIRNIEENNLSGYINVFNYGLSNKNGTERLYINGENPGSNSIIFNDTENSSLISEIKVCTLDSFGQELNNQTHNETLFIKMDIEGAEKYAIEGGLKYISSFNEVYLLIEDFVDNSIIDYLIEVGFRNSSKLTPYNSFWYFKK